MLKLFTKVKNAAKKVAERCKLRKPRPREYTIGEEYKNINMINDRLFIETMVSYTMVLDNIAAMLEENAIVRELAFNPRTSAINSIRSASSSTAANSVNSVRPMPKTGISVSRAAKEKRISNQIAKQKRAQERLDIIDGEFFDSEFFDDDTTADEVSNVFIKEPDCRSIADNNSTASSTALPHISDDLDFDLIDLSDAESTRSYFSTPLETDSLLDGFDTNNQPNVRKSLSSGLIDNKLAIAEAQAIKKNKALIRATVHNNASICIAT
ncbi:hypothetical protein H4R99_005101 [Coemansia sp. RSA 1722]|nr:hypothetical protein LPJ57_001945 [Coemansia sp. RSA 486]KAJ2225399.1 hypothetical protein IWW45_007895 [Coemansia sp. RSA 485]KAJ2595998.1 hypothetical protein H4R99_005101 [Coemansia sp. RSA 1722]